MESTLESDQSWFPVFYFFLTGGGAVVSWNAMLNSFDYFNAKYPDFQVSFLFPIAIYVAQLLSSLVMTQLSSKLSYLIRLMGSYLLVTLILAFIPFEAVLLEGTTLGFWLVMLLLFIVGFLSNICFSSAMGLASQLRGKYTTFIFMGSAFIGLFMSILREISSLIFTSSDSNEIFNVAFFFGMAALFLLVTIIMQPIFIRSTFYRTRFIQPEKAVLGDIENKTALVQDNHLGERNFKLLFGILKEVALPIFLLVVCYIQTYAVFPGVMEEKDTPTISGQTKVVSMALSFMFPSLVGKIIGRYRRIYSLCGVGTVVVLRFVLIVFFVIQAATSEIDVFNTLWFGYLNIILFGLSYGFITVSLCIIAPEQVSGEKKEIAGYISIFALNIGTVIGTLIALPFRNLEPVATT